MKKDFESQTTEFKLSWQDEYMKVICALQKGLKCLIKGLQRAQRDSKGFIRAQTHPKARELTMTKIFLQDIIGDINLSTLPYNWNSGEIPEYDILFLTHRDDLIEQFKSRLKDLKQFIA